MMGVAGASHAALMTATDPVTPDTEAGCHSPFSFTCGWSFNVDQTLYVTALGQWDDDLDGLSTTADVGLWLADGTLLRSATVAAGTGATLIGDFRFADVATLTLLAGTQYVIGSYFLGGANDLVGTSEFNPLVNPIDKRFISGSFAFPSGGVGITSDFFSGPTFLFDTVSPVPLPPALLLFASGLIGLAGIGRLRRRKKTGRVAA